MRTVRKYSAMMTILAAVVLVGCNGCNTLQEGADPVVVRAEQTASVAFDLFDVYVKMEYNNREGLASISPNFKQVGDVIRTDGLKAIEELRIATKVYKANRNEQNKANLQTYMALVENLQRVVNEYLIAPKKAGVNLPPVPAVNRPGIPSSSGTNR